jgi:glutamine amidotransferase
LSAGRGPRAAIIDFGGGNLYNVRRACLHVGLDGFITDDAREAEEADALILPGVGAMAQAVERLQRAGLSTVVAEASDAGIPILGVCLGFQLLMARGTEFGEYAGLGFFPGSVERFPGTDTDGKLLRVPHIGWSAVRPPQGKSWENSLLADVPVGSSMYFVHSYFVKPESASDVIAVASYGGREFAAAMESGNTFASQFHPERSGGIGLRVYERFAQRVRETTGAGEGSARSR